MHPQQKLLSPTPHKASSTYYENLRQGLPPPTNGVNITDYGWPRWVPKAPLLANGSPDLTKSNVAIEVAPGRWLEWPNSFSRFDASASDAAARCFAVGAAQVAVDQNDYKCEFDLCYLPNESQQNCNARMNSTAAQQASVYGPAAMMPPMYYGGPMPASPSPGALSGGPNNATSSYYFRWDESYNDGAGYCIMESPDQYSWSYGEFQDPASSPYSYNPTRPRTVADITKWRTDCGAAGGQTYLGRRFQKGEKDTKEKCESKYCSVLGPYAEVSEEDCTAIGGRCTNANGWRDGRTCAGCERDYRQAGPSGLCVKVVSNATAECSIRPL